MGQPLSFENISYCFQLLKDLRLDPVAESALYELFHDFSKADRHELISLAFFPVLPADTLTPPLLPDLQAPLLTRTQRQAPEPDLHLHMNAALTGNN